MGLVAGGLVLFLGLRFFDLPDSKAQDRFILEPIASESPTPGLELGAGEPRVLSIPKLGISTMVEPVGQDATGRMATPEEVVNVSWWMLGTKPGNLGAAVMAGHLDTPTGSPAVFFYLDGLALGDEVEVTDKDGQVHVFVVKRKEIYKDSEFPIEEVFLDPDGKSLNLITCTGDWDKEENSYQDRLVVFTELVGSANSTI